MPERDPRAVYRERAARFGEERDRLAHRSRRISWGRLLGFLGAVGLLVRAETAPPGERALPLALGVALLVTFVVLVVRHAAVRRRHRRLELLAALNAEAVHRLARDWDHLPGSDVPGPPAEHAYAGDIDLFGNASLFQLLSTVATTPGRDTLRSWLLAPAAPDEIRLRQGAVAELAPRLDLRDEIAVHGRMGPDLRPEDLDHFLAWAEDEPWLLRRPLVLWAARLLPFAIVGLGIADLVGAVEQPLWLLPALAGMALSRAVSRNVHGTFQRAFAREGAFQRYAGVFRLLAEDSFDSPRLTGLHQRLHEGGIAAHRRMRRLGRIMELADLRFSSSAHFVIHTLTLWDFHVLYALERWQQGSGRLVRSWFEALGEVDALAALAALAYDNPGWSFPEILEDNEPILEAKALGHPMLAPDVRVTNDVVVGPPGTFLLVTGSNMSGKSTLLRAIGTNVVLAQAGGPVCATTMRLSPVALFTSMRVSDSLSRGVSYFMAELNRLKQVVDAAEETKGTGRTLLYLLDEILHGTNTAERQIAAQRVILHLVAQGAIGAVSTHDLAMASSPEITAVARPVHLTETVHRDETGRLVMSFDYTLRPGIATSTNALKLMEIVGLAVDGE